MRWKGGQRSQNVEDRRHERQPRQAAGAAVGGAALLRFLPMLMRSKGGRSILIIGVVVFFGAKMLGVDLMPLLTGGGQMASQPVTAPEIAPEQQELADFVSVVLADTETTWHQIFAQYNQSYQEPKLELYSNQVRSACGQASAAVGPFYCPADRKIYIDLSFYQELKNRHGAPGDFAQAYVIAHEVGHHIQTLMGTSQKVFKARQRLGQTEANALSVKQELQADCYAGIWAHHADEYRNLLEIGDLEEALNAASAIGDDALQRKATGQVRPDSFTHGTSKQRMEWFQRGYDQGSLESCDTFA